MKKFILLLGVLGVLFYAVPGNAVIGSSKQDTRRESLTSASALAAALAETPETPEAAVVKREAAVVARSSK